VCGRHTKEISPMFASDGKEPDDRKWILYDCITYTCAVLYVLFVGFMYYAHYFGNG